MNGPALGRKKNSKQKKVKLLDDGWLVSPDKLDPTASSMKHLICDSCTSRFSLIVSTILSYISLMIEFCN